MCRDIENNSLLVFLLLFIVVANLVGCKGENGNWDEIYQTVIDLPELQQYYRIDEFPERKPLIVIKNKFIKGPFRLNKFNEPVVLMTKDDTFYKGISHYFEFAEIQENNNIIDIKFRYPVEGIVGHAILIKNDHGITIQKTVIGKNGKIQFN